MAPLRFHAGLSGRLVGRCAQGALQAPSRDRRPDRPCGRLRLLPAGVNARSDPLPSPIHHPPAPARGCQLIQRILKETIMCKFFKLALDMAGALLVATSAFADAADVSPGEGQQFEAQTGEQLYASVCAACHMPDGEGATG